MSSVSSAKNSVFALQRIVRLIMLDEVDGVEVEEADKSADGDTPSAYSIAVIAVQVGVSMKSSDEIIVDSNKAQYRDVAK